MIITLTDDDLRKDAKDIPVIDLELINFSITQDQVRMAEAVYYHKGKICVTFKERKTHPQPIRGHRERIVW